MVCGEPEREHQGAGTRGQLAALETALELWAERDNTIPQPEVTRAGHAAVEAIDALTCELYSLRQRLIVEIRASGNAAIARTDALLARLRQERQA
jgi:hypothetical protein